jgi:hypothetical protein
VLKHLGKRSITGRRRKLGGLFALLLACVIGVGAYAFTASNTVPAHKAGAGSGAVSGYEVTSHVSYSFSADGTKMTEAHFKLSAAASDVQVALTENAPVKEDWTDCGATGAENEVACNLKEAPAFPEGVPDGEGNKLSVAAVSEGKVVIE